MDILYNPQVNENLSALGTNEKMWKLSVIVFNFVIFGTSLSKGILMGDNGTDKSCDLIVIKPINYFDKGGQVFSEDSQAINVLLSNAEGHKIKVGRVAFMESNFRTPFFVVLQLSTSKVKCQTMLMNSSNPKDLHMASRIYHQSLGQRSNLVVFSNNTDLAMMRLPFDLDVIVPYGKRASYQPTQDIRWRTLQVSWAELRPYVYPGVEDSVAGIDYNVWKTMGKKLGMNLVFGNKSASFVDMYMALAYRRAEIALLGTAYIHSMLQVLKFLIRSSQQVTQVALF